MNNVLLIIAGFGGVVGALSTLCCVIMLPVVIVWKFYRRIRHGISIFK